MKQTLLLAATIPMVAGAVITVPLTSSAKPNLLPAYVSFSIELEGFPSYAGNSSSGVNEYSVNLLTNLGSAMGEMPVIRVGGNTADEVIFQEDQKEAISSDCAVAKMCMGKSFFDSYNSFPKTSFTHGFNMVANNASGFTSLRQQVAHGCKTLEGKLTTWEYGNEVDLYIGSKRPSDWDEADYVEEWAKGTHVIIDQLQKTCPSLAEAANLRFSAPNLAGVPSKLNPVTIFSDHLDANKTVAKVTVHNYMGIAGSTGTTLQGTLMNHQKNIHKLDEHAQSAKQIASVPGMSTVPYVIGEHNSLAGGGATGLSNTLGAALWGLDFVLQAAATGQIKRLHFHTNVGAPYAPWNPVTGQTEPPYYGHIAAAKFMGESQSRAVMNLSVPTDNTYLSAYAGYNSGTKALDRLAAINLRLFNSSTSGTRGSQSYPFKVKASSTWAVDRLQGAGGEVTSGVTFGGYAYEYSTLGKPRLVGSGTETIKAGSDGVLNITVPDSEAAVLYLKSN